jgi:membrane protease YdiL (CAAX protease family)
MSENAATITRLDEVQNASNSRPLLLSLFYLFLKVMLYMLVFGLPAIILNRTEYNASSYKSAYEFLAYCGVLICSIREASKKFGGIQLMSVLKPNHIILTKLAAPVMVGILALTVIIDQSNAFVEQPPNPLLNKGGLGFLLAMLVAPVLEEILCRGIVLKYLLTKAKPWVAILYSALFFSVIHMNLYQGIPVFFAGLFLGWIYYRCKSIWPGVLAHGANNVLSCVFFLFYSGEDQSYLELLGLKPYLIVLILSIAAMVLCCKAIQMKTSSREEVN